MSLLYKMMQQDMDSRNRFDAAQRYGNINDAITRQDQERQYLAQNEDLIRQTHQGPMQSFENSQFDEVSTADRHKAQIDSFIRSSNPILQKKGLEMLTKSYDHSLKGPEKGTAAIQGYDLAKSEGFEGNFMDYQQAQKPQMFEKSTFSVGDLKNLEMPDPNNPGEMIDVPVGTRKEDAAGLGIQYKRKASTDEAGKSAMLQTAIDEFPIIDKYLIESDGSIDKDMVTAGWMISKMPEWGKSLGKAGMKKYAEANGIDPAVIDQASQVAHAFELGIQGITRTETGAAMGSQEIDNTRTRFQPAPGDSDELILQKYKAYKYFLTSSKDLINPNITDKAQATAEVNRAADEALAKFDVGRKASSDIAPPPWEMN